MTEIALRDAGEATHAFHRFRDWCEAKNVVLVTARLAHGALREAGYLEAQGFRFIELNYRPLLQDLSGFTADPAFTLRIATPADSAKIEGIAAQIFEAGRFHMDPYIGPEIGNRRYALWAARAFANPSQQVLACEHEGRIAAFIVVEAPEPETRFWSLVGLAPGLAGRGLGQRIWRAVLAHHASEGVTRVSTSISSHNGAAHNLYVSLGFRFPAPAMMLHWWRGAAAAQTL